MKNGKKILFIVGLIVVIMIMNQEPKKEMKKGACAGSPCNLAPILNGIGTVDHTDTSWNAVHDSAVGSCLTHCSSFIRPAARESSGTWSIGRAFVPISTEELPDTAVITSATLYLYAGYETHQDNDNQAYVQLVGPTTQASTSNLIEADYNKCPSSGYVTAANKWSAQFDLDALPYNDWVAIPLNANALANIQTTAGSVLRIGIREGHDIIDSPILAGEYNSISFGYQDPELPYLEVSYTVVLQTCSAQGGSCCSGGETCSGGTYSSSDCGTTCCAVPCTSPSTGCTGSPCILYPSMDIDYRDTTDGRGWQIKLDIDTIPSGSTIDSTSKICLFLDYILDLNANVRYWRIPYSETWDESSNAATIEGQAKTDQSDGVWSPFVTGSYVCIQGAGIQNIIQAEVDASNPSVTVRGWHPIYGGGTIDNVYNTDTLTLGDVGWNELKFHSSENTNKPYLEIDYTAGCTPSCADPSTEACGTTITDGNGCGSCPDGNQCGGGDTCSAGTCVSSGGGVCDTTPKDCTTEWGFDCSGGGNDATFDGCNGIQVGAARIDNVLIDGTVFGMGSTVEVTCQMFDNNRVDIEQYIYYHNGVGWSEIDSRVSPGCSTCDFTTSFSIGGDVGTQWIRCINDFDGESDSCASAGSHYDNDDLSFEVVSGSCMAGYSNFITDYIPNYFDGTYILDTFITKSNQWVSGGQKLVTKFKIEFETDENVFMWIAIILLIILRPWQRKRSYRKQVIWR